MHTNIQCAFTEDTVYAQVLYVVYMQMGCAHPHRACVFSEKIRPSHSGFPFQGGMFQTTEVLE